MLRGAGSTRYSCSESSHGPVGWRHVREAVHQPPERSTLNLQKKWRFAGSRGGTRTPDTGPSDIELGLVCVLEECKCVWRCPGVRTGRREPGHRAFDVTVGISV